MHCVKEEKGFTLVELIVVIAIIAILASVSIIGFQSYISRARLSNDTTDAKNMTNVLQAYMIRHNLDEVDPVEVRAIVNIDNDYSFVPRVGGHSFWYNAETRSIHVLSSYETMILEEDFSELGYQKHATLLLKDYIDGEHALDATVPDVGEELEEIVEGFYLLDVAGSVIADSLMLVRNLRFASDLSTASSQLDGYSKIKDHIDANFKLDETLFVNDFYSLTGSTTTVNKVIFSVGIECMPGDLFKDAVLDESISELKIPPSVTYIESNAFKGLTTAKIVVDDVNVLRIEEKAFDPEDEINVELKDKQGLSTNLYTISMTFELKTASTSYYSPIVEGQNQSFLGRTKVVDASLYGTDPTDDYDGSGVDYVFGPDDIKKVVKVNNETDKNVYDASYVSADNEMGIAGWEYELNTGETYDKDNHDWDDYIGYYYYVGTDYHVTLDAGDEFDISADYCGDARVVDGESYQVVYLLVLIDEMESIVVDNNGDTKGFIATQNHVYISDIYNFSYASLGYHMSWFHWKATASSAKDLWGWSTRAYQKTVSQVYKDESGVVLEGTALEDSDLWDIIDPANFIMTENQSNMILSLVDNPNVVIDGVHITYRYVNGITYCEIKGYNNKGKLIAKGSATLANHYTNINTGDLTWEQVNGS